VVSVVGETMRLNSGLLLGAALLVTLSACNNGSPSGPTPPSTCTYTLSTTALSLGATGGQTSVTVTTGSTCTWTAASDRDWISVTSGATGTGTGSVAVGVAPNPTTAARTGALTIAGQVVAVTESGLPACSVAISPTSASFGSDPATGSLTVTALAHCPWTAASNAAWLTITAGATGTGNGTVAYAVGENNEPSTRNAAIIVNERTFTVIQAAEPVDCEYSVSPVDFTPCMAFTSDMTALVTTQATCSWTASPTASWITVTGGQSGNGTGVITFHVSENWDPPRQGIVEVRWPTVTAGQNLRVMQAGCYYAVSTSAISVGAAGGTARFEVIQSSDPIGCGGPLQNACLWTAVSHASWITITSSMPRTGDDPVNFVVAPNGTGSARTGTIVVRDKVVTITQAGV